MEREVEGNMFTGGSDSISMAGSNYAWKLSTQTVSVYQNGLLVLTVIQRQQRQH